MNALVLDETPQVISPDGSEDVDGRHHPDCPQDVRSTLSAEQRRDQQNNEPGQQEPLLASAPPRPLRMGDRDPYSDKKEDANRGKQLGPSAVVVAPVLIPVEVEHSQRPQQDFHFYTLGMFVGKDRDLFGAAFEILRVM